MHIKRYNFVGSTTEEESHLVRAYSHIFLSTAVILVMHTQTNDITWNRNNKELQKFASTFILTT